MYENILNELLSLKDPQKAESVQRYFKTGEGEYGEGDIFLGISVPTLRKIAKKHPQLVLNEIASLLHSEYHEARLVALYILVARFNTKKSTLETKEEIFNFYIKNKAYINNWDLVDSSAHYIVGAYLFKKDTSLLYTLARSPRLWDRRIAIMSSFYFIREQEYKDALLLCETLLQDTHDLIHKAVGWMLREIGNRNLDSELTFLKKHYKNMPRTMLRYAIEKFDPPLRENFLKGHI